MRRYIIAQCPHGKSLVLWNSQRTKLFCLFFSALAKWIHGRCNVFILAYLLYLLHCAWNVKKPDRFYINRDDNMTLCMKSHESWAVSKTWSCAFNSCFVSCISISFIVYWLHILVAVLCRLITIQTRHVYLVTPYCPFRKNAPAVKRFCYLLIWFVTVGCTRSKRGRINRQKTAQIKCFWTHYFRDVAIDRYL